MEFRLKLIDPDNQLDHGNILAEDRHTYKTVKVEILDRGISKCINLQKLDDGFISIDTDTGRLSTCDFRRLSQKNDTIKIKLTDGVNMDDEFAMFGGKVTLWHKGNEMNLGLNGSDLSNIRIKITKDCAEERRKIPEAEKKAKEKLEEEIKERDACEPDIPAIRDHRDDVIVKSTIFDGKVGSVNLSCWYFQGEDLYYNLTFDKVKSGKKVGNNNVYLKVLPCNEEQKYYKLALCDQNGNLATKTDGGDESILYVSKCNLIGGQKIQLRDYIREDGLPSFTIKPSESKELGESYGNKFRAEVYEYDPISHDIGEKVGKLNATIIINKLHIRNAEALRADNFLLDTDIKSFLLDKMIIATEKDDLYQLDTVLYPSIVHSQRPIEAETTKLLLDDLLCLYDQDSLQDGVQIIG